MRILLVIFLYKLADLIYWIFIISIGVFIGMSALQTAVT